MGEVFLSLLLCYRAENGGSVRIRNLPKYAKVKDGGTGIQILPIQSMLLKHYAILSRNFIFL